MIVRELVTRLGLDGAQAERSANRIDRTMQGLRQTMQAVVTASAAVGTAMIGLARSTASYGDEVAKTAGTLGIASEQLQAYRFAFDRVGIEQQELTNGLERLNRNLGQAALGNRAAQEAFARLGVEIFDATGRVRTLGDLFPDVIESIGNMEDGAIQAALAQDVFGRSGIRLGRALRQGRGEMERLVQRFKDLGGGITDTEAAMSELATDATTDLSTIVNGLRLQIGADLLPAFIGVTNAVTDWIMENRDLIRQNVARFFDGVITVARLLYNVMQPIVWLFQTISRAANSLTGTLGTLASAITGLALTAFAAGLFGVATGVLSVSRAFALMAGVISRVPVILAVISALLILEDLIFFFAGKESVIGDVFAFAHDEIEGFTEAVEGIRGAVDAVGDTFRGLAHDVWASIADMGANWSAFITELRSGVGPIEAIGNLLGREFGRGVDMIESLAEAFEDVIGYMVRSVNIGANLLSIIESIFSLIPGGGSTDTPAPGLDRGRMGGDGSSSIAPLPGGGIGGGGGAFSPIMPNLMSAPGGSNTNIFNESITVNVPANTGADQVELISRTVRDEVDRSIERQLRAAATNYPRYT